MRLLTDAQATRDEVVDGLEWLQRQVTQHDVGMLFFAGHGINDAAQGYTFLPANADPDRLKRTGVSMADVRSTLASLAGKALFFFDTCHAGNVLGAGRRELPRDLSGVINELAGTENGVVVFSSSTGRQFSYEDPAWRNGAFTLALVEGLNGAAAAPDSPRITHKMLDFYVSDRVKRLTDGRQTPVTQAPGGVPDFPVALKIAPPAMRRPSSHRLPCLGRRARPDAGRLRRTAAARHAAASQALRRPTTTRRWLASPHASRPATRRCPRASACCPAARARSPRASRWPSGRCAAIDAQYYHVHDDEAGHALLRALRDAARRGVRVRLLVDDLYSGPIADLLRALAAEPQVQVRLFNPLPVRGGPPLARLALSWPEFERINHRMHNKLLVVDGVVAIYGGRNIGDAYFMRDGEANFVDLDVLSTGAVVRELASAFDLYWNSDRVWPVQAVLGQASDADRTAFDDRTGATPTDLVTEPPRDVLGQTPVPPQLAAAG